MEVGNPAVEFLFPTINYHAIMKLWTKKHRREIGIGSTKNRIKKIVNF